MSLKHLKLKIEKRAAKFCISSRLCVKSAPRPVDYDFTPYEPEKATSNNNTNIPVSEALHAQIAKNRLSLENLNRLKKQTTQLILYNQHLEFDSPELQSTRLEQSTASGPNPLQTNTFLYTTIGSLDSSGADCALDDGLMEESEEDDSILICCESYSGEYRDDLSVHCNDRVQVLMVKEAFILARNVDTDQCGFVPRDRFK